MITAKYEYNQRKDDIEKCYELLDDIMQKNGDVVFDGDITTLKHVSGDTKLILRSSFFLMLYNCVESTVTNCLTAICNAIIAEDCKFSDLRNEVKTAIVESYDYQTRNSNLSHEQHVSVLKSSIDVFCFSTPIRLTLNEYIHSSSQGTYSGSLDAKEIKKQFSRFGVNLEDLRCDQLVKIRDNRNKLGHGEVSFLECSNDSTIQYLEKAKIKMFEFFDKVIDRVEEYVNNKRFLAANVLP